MDKEKKKPQEDKAQGKSPLDISRRTFLKGMGTTAIATSITIAPLSLPSITDAAPPPAVREAWIQLTVNDKAHRLKVKSHWTLLDVLRKEIGLTGPKKFCDRGSCGACTVLMDGKSVYACSLLAVEADNKKILTIEGLLQGGKLHPIQEAFLEHDGVQCGFCTPGQIMSVKALLDKNPRPSPDEIKEGLSGNLCRCSAYPKILKSAMAAAQRG
jgi:aerobic-type carbon monoxide dehydrogenase small subunit (CoxS/CutS family)